MSNSKPFAQVDVFSERIGDGNPLPVFFDCDDLQAITMQRIASWLNYSETVFLQSSEYADYRVRIFTIDREMEFAGHPVIGASFAILDKTNWEQHDVNLETSIGIVRLTADESKRIQLKVPEIKILPACINETEASRLINAGVHHPLPINVGITWLTMRADDLTTLYKLDIDVAELERLSIVHNLEGIGIYAIDSESRVHVRNLFVVSGRLIEDPVCGSGNACVAHHIRSTGAMASGIKGYRAFQGKVLGRDGRLEIRFDGGDIILIGSCQRVITGLSSCCGENKIAGTQ